MYTCSDVIIIYAYFIMKLVGLKLSDINWRNKVISLTVAIMYNMFFHKLANVTGKNLDFDERKKKAINVLFMAGIAGVVIGYILIQGDFKYKSDMIGLGLQLGGIFLIASSVINNWDEMNDNLKLVLIGGGLVGLCYYYY